MKFTFYLLFFTGLAFSQSNLCDSNHYFEKNPQNSVAKLRRQNLQNQFEHELQRLKNSESSNLVKFNPTDVIRIPVAVHFPYVTNASASLKDCLRSLAQTQINILNADFNASNAEVSQWSSDSSFYPGTTIGSMNVEFVLATQNHPAGTGLVNGDLAVTFGTDFFVQDPDFEGFDMTWAGYCNIVVVNFPSEGPSGFAPLGGTPSNGAMVVVDDNAFSAIMTGNPATCEGFVPQAPLDLGRVVTHELGHYFNLEHTFFECDAADCSTSGDKVCDTPSTSTPNLACSAAGSVTSNCSSIPQLTMNFMDYSEHACMYMFTTGQVQRMIAWYNTIANQFSSNVLATESFEKNFFSLSPNPNNGTFVVTFEKPICDYSVQVVDVMGKPLFNERHFNDCSGTKSFTISNAKPGLYFMTIQFGNGIMTQKILIE